MNRIILITGPKYSGKSLCAKALHEITGGVLVDLDETMEAQTGKTPRELFVCDPEIFKKAESHALASVLQFFGKDQMSRIIAAGGGLIDNGEAMELLAKSHSPLCEITAVYLDISAETAWQRIAADGEIPPFLNTGNPRETHRALHKRRADAYKAMASIIVTAENKSPEEIAREIADFLNITRI